MRTIIRSQQCEILESRYFISLAIYPTLSVLVCRDESFLQAQWSAGEFTRHKVIAKILRVYRHKCRNGKESSAYKINGQIKAIIIKKISLKTKKIQIQKSLKIKSFQRL